MICDKCGKILPEDSLFCQYCGASCEAAEAAAETEQEALAAAPAAATAPAAEPQADRAEKTEQPTGGKARYCRECGGLVDPDTKKCTKCGKQYFRFPKKQVGRAVVVLLFLAMAGGLVYLYGQNQSLNEDLMDKKLEDISIRYPEVYSEYNFYHDQAVIVGKDIPYYHSYGCSELFDENGNWKMDFMWIYNTENAERLGYEPCPKCQ